MPTDDDKFKLDDVLQASGLPKDPHRRQEATDIDTVTSTGTAMTVATGTAVSRLVMGKPMSYAPLKELADNGGALQQAALNLGLQHEADAGISFGPMGASFPDHQRDD